MKKAEYQQHVAGPEDKQGQFSSKRYYESGEVMRDLSQTEYPPMNAPNWTEATPSSRRRRRDRFGQRRTRRRTRKQRRAVCGFPRDGCGVGEFQTGAGREPQNVPVSAIRKLLGHRSVETTMRYLEHLYPDFDAVRAASESEVPGLPWETANGAEAPKNQAPRKPIPNSLGN